MTESGPVTESEPVIESESRDEQVPAAPEPPDPASPTSPDPEDWQSTAASGDDERYLRERPPHWE